MKWIKLNVYLRIGVLIILVLIGMFVIYHKYGYVNPDDSKLFDSLGNEIITCREALYYYAENELDIYEGKSNINPNEINITLDNLESMFIEE